MHPVMRKCQGLFILILLALVTLNMRLLWRVRKSGDTVQYIQCEPSVVQVDQPVQISPQVSLSRNFSKSFISEKWKIMTDNQTKVIGHPRSTKGFLSIGIPSIKRDKGMGMIYLSQTISSVITNTSPDDKQNTVLIVFLADLDVAYNQEVLRLIEDKHKELIISGFIHILQVLPDYYPKLNGLKRNFNDQNSRVSWRAKQVADFSAMFMYARNISHYYIQLEDDVMCANHFVPLIHDFIQTRRTHWAVLEFSELGFIGKLFKSEDLEKLAHFMMTFYDEQPVDWLIRYYRMSMAQPNVIMRKPTLFQHMGTMSSYDTSKDNKLKDRFFSDDGSDSGNAVVRFLQKQFTGAVANNPPAQVFSDMVAHRHFTVQQAYKTGDSFFWAVDVQPSNAISVIFDKPQDIDRVVVSTGDTTNPNDILHTGWVELSQHVIRYDAHTGLSECSHPTKISDFILGQVDVSHIAPMLNGTKVGCMRIVVGAAQKEWVIFKQISVFTSKA